MSVAGPATHFPGTCVWLAIQAASNAGKVQWAMYYLTPTSFWVNLTIGAVQLNVILCLFNLLVPAYPLDGGRVFAGALLLNGVPRERAAYITAGTGGLLGLGAAIYGLVALNFNLIGVGAWIVFSSYQLYSSVKEGKVDQHPLFAAANNGWAPAPQQGSSSSASRA